MQHNTLKLERFAMHRVPQGAAKGESGPEVQLSDVESPHDADIDAFFRSKITGAFGNQSLNIEPLDAGGVTGAAAAKAIIADPGELMPRSRELAKELFGKQDRRNPDGILVVATGQIDSLPCVAILKLEHEKGVRADLEGKPGQRAFSIQVLHDLMLTDKTRLFKVAVFRPKSASNDVLSGIACDNQVADLADFFLKSFLGCRLTTKPEVTTQHFFEAAEDFINTIDESEQQARYEIALLATLQSASQKVNPRKFAEHHFAAEHHQPFLNHLQSRGVPKTEFIKDIELISTKLTRVGLSFGSGAKLVVPTDAYDNEVKVEESSEGRAKVTIDDTIVGSHGRGR